MYSLIAISYFNEILIILLPIIVFIAVFGIMGEISIDVDFIADYVLRKIYLFIPLLYLYRTADCSNNTRGEVF